MKVRLVTVSHRQPSWVDEAFRDYERRLPREWAFRLVEVKPEPRTSGASVERVHAAEADRLRAALPAGTRVIALEERGKPWSTAELARHVERWQHEARDLAFVIGGADGFDPDFVAAADVRLSLSPMTLPHGLVRVVIVEQLYRAASILRGHPYHR